MAKKKKKLTTGIIIARIILVLLTTVIGVALILAVALGVIIKGPSVAARDTFVTTVLESGSLKFLAKVYLSEDEINEIIEKTSMDEMEEEQEKGLIQHDGDVEGDFDENGIQVVKISSSNYYATLLIVKDPSKVVLSTTYPWGDVGENLDVLVENAGAVAGINGGIYASALNKGGCPYGVCVCNGEIQYNDPSGWAGLYMVGMDNDNDLRIVSIDGWTAEQFEAYVKSEGIRDAVAFQDELTGDNNHFCPLIINGVAREFSGEGSGLNPRTVIGQRADGAILLLVTDGRGSAGHLGATASDLISIMLKYDAVNAANLDGGSSSCMYYDGEWLMNSVTLWAANESWRLPNAFVVMGGN